MSNVSRVAFTILIACLTATVALAAVPETERQLVTDPQALADRGLPPETEQFYVRVQSDASSTIAPEGVSGGEVFGTLDVDHSPISAHGFNGRTSDFAYDWVSPLGVSCNSGSSEVFADAEFHMPTGVVLSYLRWWTYDTDAEDMRLFLWEWCQPVFSAGAPAYTELLDVAASSGTGGNYSDSGFVGVTVDNPRCSYKVRVRFGSADGSCDGASLQLMKVRAEWHRQISPAPGTATFNDVPTGHPFFQHVEALVDSGITAGCGGGNYCPDQSLTRGQMAVFLAKALGLHWYWNNF